MDASSMEYSIDLEKVFTLGELSYEQSHGTNRQELQFILHMGTESAHVKQNPEENLPFKWCTLTC